MKVIFIGFPGSGKSYFGKKLSEDLKYSFYDDDLEMLKKYGLNTIKILEKFGDEEFLKIEENIFRKRFEKTNVIISPGGSIVYSKKLMRKIFNFSKIIYLDNNIDLIFSRIIKEPRGIVYLEKYNNNLKELFLDREKLYRKYSHHIIKVFGKSDQEILEEIKQLLV